MKLHEINISKEGVLKLELIELPKTCIVIISEGQVKISELPAFAETKIITHHGKVKRVKWDQGEEF